jgi:hypothetical protein
MAELAGFYRITRADHAFDGLGGFRYSSMDIDLDLPGSLPDVDQRKDWIDPYVGMRWQWRMAEKWGLRMRGDIGGFGIGSDLTWNQIIFLPVALNPRASFIFSINVLLPTCKV